MAIIIASIGLQGCGVAVVSGIALAGYAAYDRKNIESRVQDKTIIYQAYANIKDNAEDIKANAAQYKNSHIVITSFHGNLLATGQVPTEEYKNTVTAILNDTQNAGNVYN